MKMNMIRTKMENMKRAMKKVIKVMMIDILIQNDILERLILFFDFDDVEFENVKRERPLHVEERDD